MNAKPRSIIRFIPSALAAAFPLSVTEAQVTPPSNAWALADGGGATAAPLIGEIPGALEGGAVFSADGPFPGTGSVEFDGNSAEVNMGELVFNGATRFSLSIWIRSDGAGQDRGFWEVLDNGGSDTFNIRYDSVGANAGAIDTIKLGIQTESGGFDGEYSDDIQTDEWQHIAVTYDGDAGEFILYVDGEENEPSDTVDAAGPLTNMDYFRLGDGAKAHWLGKISEVAVWGDHVLTGEEVGVLATQSLTALFEGFDPDADDDGIPDAWEEQFGLSGGDAADAQSDNDGDTLTALQEFQRGTDPTKGDTDGDTLPDNVETNTGIYVDAGNTGTDPTSTDTDSDNLADNVETNTGTYIGETDTGTSPVAEDTDEDGIRDGTEVAAGSDPTDATSTPGGGAATAVYGEPEGGWDESFTGDILPSELDWNHGNGSDEWDGKGITDEDSEPGGVEVFSEQGISYLRIQDTVTSGGTGNNRKIMFTKPVLDGLVPLEEGGEGVTLHFRLRLATGDNIDESIVDWLPEGDGASIRFGGKGMLGIDTTTGTFGFALGTTDADEALPATGLMLNGIIGVDDQDNIFEVADPTAWQEFWVTIAHDPDAEEGTHRINLWHNGATEPVAYEVGTGGSQDVSGDPEPRIYLGHPGTDQITAYDVDFFNVKAGVFDPTAGGGSLFQITGVHYDPATRSCSISWPARSGTTYKVEVSQDANPFVWLELADGVTAEEDTASFTENALPVDARARYYRVQEE